MFHHRLWYWRWSWSRLWLVVWVPCRQKRNGPSGRRSKILAQISQKCVSCSNYPPKCVERSLWQLDYLTNIVDSLPTICKDSHANFCYVFRCCACWPSSRTLIDVDRHSSVLEKSAPQKILLWLMALSPKASCSIWWVSAAVFFKDWKKICCRFLLLKIRHISCKKIAGLLKHNLTKTHWN